MEVLPKLVVILGPTASGKTDLAITLAKKYNGEIVSADSRQIFRELSIGTAKPTGKWVGDRYMVEGVPHYLVNCVDPSDIFTLADFKREANVAIQDIIRRGKTPFLVGGTGLYISAIVDNLDIPNVAPNQDLRKNWEAMTTIELQNLIKKNDPKTATTIDLQNKRRLVRALEVATVSGKSFRAQQTKSPALFDILQIGILWPKEILESRIEERIKKQIEQGFLNEVEALWQKYGAALTPSFTSIGYGALIAYLTGEMNWPEALIIFKNQTRQYAKRQMTWFKRDGSVHWVAGGETKEAERLTGEFLSI